jgi:hypothetical protein
MLLALMRDRWIGVRLQFDDDPDDRQLRALFDQRELIEPRMPCEVRWDFNDERKRSFVECRHPDMDPNDEPSWRAQAAWFGETLATFRAVFDPLLKNLEPHDAD